MSLHPRTSYTMPQSVSANMVFRYLLIGCLYGKYKRSQYVIF
jgi:hypothetical protein